MALLERLQTADPGRDCRADPVGLLLDLERRIGDRLPRGRDYVLVVRAGLPETAEARGFEWLGERVDEVLGKAAA